MGQGGKSPWGKIGLKAIGKLVILALFIGMVVLGIAEPLFGEVVLPWMLLLFPFILFLFRRAIIKALTADIFVAMLLPYLIVAFVVSLPTPESLVGSGISDPTILIDLIHHPRFLGLMLVLMLGLRPTMAPIIFLAKKCLPKLFDDLTPFPQSAFNEMNMRPILQPTPGFDIGLRYGVAFLATLSCVLLPCYLVWAAFFWIQWVMGGAMILILGVFPCSLLGTVLAVNGPLRGWVIGLLTGAWREPALSAGEWRVHIIDEMRVERFIKNCSQGGLLREERGDLVLSAGGKTWRISLDAISEIKPLRRTSFLQYVLSPTYRLFNRPVRLRWRVVEDGQEVAHSVLLVTRSGWGFGAGLRRDRRLAAALEAWQTGMIGLETSRERSSAGPGSLVAALFLAMGLLTPWAHNFLIVNWIRMGHWPPRVAVRDFVPVNSLLIPSIDALTPGTVLCESGRMDGFFPMLVNVNPYSGHLRPVTTWASWFDVPVVPSYPGECTHILAPSSYAYLGCFLIPPKLSLVQLSDPRFAPFVDQVVDVKTGRHKDIHSIPKESNKAVSLAFFRGEKIFYTSWVRHRYEVGLRYSWIEADIGWIDVEHDQRHPLGQLKIESIGEGQLTPVFFPDGRHVLYAWNVIDIDTGTAHPLEPITRPDFLSSCYGLSDTFTSGRCLCQGVTLYDANWLNKPFPRKERKEIWEIDPVTAKRRTIQLPENTTLVSADGDRWLIKARHEVKDSSGTATRRVTGSFSLFNPKTSKVRPLFIETNWASRFLVRGRDEILEYAGKNVWNRRVIPPE